jgi:4-amino-4-deoxy-L-arabinose transferase-like glycosyltransferase
MKMTHPAPQTKLHFIIIAGILISLALILGLHLVSVTKYPIVFTDEPWIANTAWTWLTTGVNFDAINTGSRDQFGYEWLHWPIIGHLPLVASFSLLGLGLFQARLVSLIFGIMLLISVALVGRLSYSTMTGFLAALLLSLSAPFLQSSHWVRPDIMLAAVIVLSYALALYALKENKWWAHFLAALLLGGSLDIHQSGSLFIPGLVAMYIVTYKTRVLRQTGTWLAAAGGLLGIFYYVALHILPSPSVYATLASYSYQTIHRFPLQMLSVSSLLSSLRGEIGQYRFYNNNLDFALIGASVIYLAYRRSRSDRLLLVFVTSAFISSVLFQGNKTGYYAILFYPFLMLMVAEMFVSLMFNRQTVSATRVFAAALLVLFVFNSAVHFARPVYQNRDYDYYSVTERFEDVIPPEARVMGAPTWWLGLFEFDYRSFDNLQLYRFFNEYGLTQGLEAVQPDIIIVDPFMDAALFESDIQAFYTGENPFPTFSRQEFQDFLKENGELVLEHNDPWYGPIQIYSLNWDLAERPVVGGE